MQHKDRTPDEKRYVIEEKTGCWIYILSIDTEGYGVYAAIGKRKSLRAHRYFYEKHKGKLSKNLDIDHLCRNRRCVNPKHLEAVTRNENLRRGRIFRESILKKQFRNFYKEAEGGGASQWLVSPETVWIFIEGIKKNK